MATGIASGLGATWGMALESTVGTYTAPTRWIPVKSDKVKGAKKTVNSEVLRGSRFYLGSHRRMMFRDAKGPVEFDVQTRQLGLLLQMMIGSTPTITQQGGTAAYLQIHTPGDVVGKSLSLQSGRPMTNGTIQPFSYNGAKITDWELSLATAGLASLICTFDAWEESTSATYTAPSYVSSTSLGWVDASLLLGGTASVAGGVTSISGGTAPVGVVKSVSIKGTNAMDVERQQIGSLNKSEQLLNAFSGYTGQVEVEFANITDVYNAFHADTGLSLQLNLQGPLIASGYYNLLDIVIPLLFFDGDPPEIDGPAILKLTAPFTIMDDGATTPIQFAYQSTDTAV